MMNHTKAYSIISIFLLFILPIQLVIAQDDSIIQMKGFSKIPFKTDITLIKKLYFSKTDKEKLKNLEKLAEYHCDRGNIDSIIYYGNEIIKQTTTMPYLYKITNLSIANNFLGIANRQKGLFDKALKYHFKGLELAEKISDSILMYRHMIGEGIVYFNKNELQTALDLYDKSLKWKMDSIKMYEIDKLKTDILLKKQKLELAKKKYLKILHFFKKEKLYKKQLEVELQLGEIEEIHKNITRTFNYYNEVKKSSEKYRFYDLYFKAQNNIGRLFYLSKQYENALISLNTAYLNALVWNNLEYQKIILDNLRRVYLKQKNYKNAHDVLYRYNKVVEIINKKQNQEEIKELEIKYSTIQKENEIKILKNEKIIKEQEVIRQKTIKKNILFTFLIVLIPILALLYLYYQKLQTQSALNITQEELNNQKIAKLLNEQEIKIVKASIQGKEKERNRIAQELHDGIGGSLAAIKLQLSNFSDRKFSIIINQIDETYHQVRNLSHSLVSKKFEDNDFVNLITHYIENINEVSSFKIVFIAHPKEKIRKMDTIIKTELFKIIQELLANAIKHAKANSIDIHLNIHENMVNLLFEDHGVGFDTTDFKEGIGLKNIKKRVKKLKEKMYLDSYPNRGTIVDINIPLK